jgi:hypothetical protein
VQAYLALPHPDASAMFDCLYETLPDAMAEQLDTARQYDASGKTDTSRPIMAELHMVEAVNLALAHALANDPDVVLLGEDIGVNGGVFRSTVGLQSRFGERVIDTPLAEGAIVGAAIGMAAMGLKPVAEIQFAGFIYPAIDNILNHAGHMRHRTRGGSRVRWSYARRAARASTRPNTIPKARRPCSRRCQASAWSCLHRRRAPTGCCLRRFATRTR